MKKKKDQRGGKRPFFVRYLEAQELAQVTGGTKSQTMRYPSDTDQDQAAN